MNRLQATGIAAAVVLVTAAGARPAATRADPRTGPRARRSISSPTPPRRRPTRSSSRRSRRPRPAPESEFTQSYGASGDQSKAVEAGQTADVVHFALEPDIKRLVDAGKVATELGSERQHGIVADTEVVFAVRKGNPKDIHTWDDLVKPGVEVITPNPFSSGGARWNIMAAYGAQINEGKTPDQAKAYLDTLFHHVPVQDDKASASLTTFTGGKGDVLLAYEQDALRRRRPARTSTIVVPAADDPDRDADRGDQDRPAASRTKFVDWMFTPAAQKILAETGYRSVLPSVEAKYASKYPARRRRSRSTTSAAGIRSWPTSSIPSRASCRRSSRAWGSRPADGDRAALAGASRRGASGRRAGPRRHVPLADRAPADGRARVADAEGRLEHVRGRRDGSRRGCRAQAHVCGGVIVAGDQRGLRHADRLGARPGRVPRQGGRSTA